MEGWLPGPGVVELPDGRWVRGGSVRRPRVTGQAPEFVVLLLGRLAGVPPATEFRWVRWPDFWLPTSTDTAIAALTDAHGRAASMRVEVACGSGIGRTGTALAFLALLGGLAAEESIDWVRASYHPRAVETPWQRAWLRRAATSVRG